MRIGIDIDNVLSNFNEILLNAYNHQEKADICLENDIDIMIDDSINVCLKCSESNIKSLLFNTEYNKSETRFTRVNDWKEIFEYINDSKEEKKNVILDTDIFNECDDQFVLAYMINKEWFTSRETSCSNIKDDTSYELTNNNHKITMINYIDVNKVFTDLFQKLGG